MKTTNFFVVILTTGAIFGCTQRSRPETPRPVQKSSGQSGQSESEQQQSIQPQGAEESSCGSYTTQTSCLAAQGCSWSSTHNDCGPAEEVAQLDSLNSNVIDTVPITTTPIVNQPAGTLAQCTQALTAISCQAISGCAWNAVYNDCGPITSMTPGNPDQCYSFTAQTTCQTAPGCTWSLEYSDCGPISGNNIENNDFCYDISTQSACQMQISCEWSSEYNDCAAKF